MQSNRLTWASFILGVFALSIALFSNIAPSMTDGDTATPGFVFKVLLLFSSAEPVTEPTFSAAPDFIITDEVKRTIFSTMAIVVSLACLTTAWASRRARQHSLGYSVGVLASVSALSLIHSVAFFVFALAAFSILFSAKSGSIERH